MGDHSKFDSCTDTLTEIFIKQEVEGQKKKIIYIVVIIMLIFIEQLIFKFLPATREKDWKLGRPPRIAGNGKNRHTDRMTQLSH